MQGFHKLAAWFDYAWQCFLIMSYIPLIHNLVSHALFCADSLFQILIAHWRLRSTCKHQKCLNTGDTTYVYIYTWSNAHQSFVSKCVTKLFLLLFSILVFSHNDLSRMGCPKKYEERQKSPDTTKTWWFLLLESSFRCETRGYFNKRYSSKKDRFIKSFSAGNLEVEKIWCDQYLFGVILRCYFSWPQPPIMLF